MLILFLFGYWLKIEMETAQFTLYITHVFIIFLIGFTSIL